eukprot:CAMPEP_0183703728 /NCGR_PEP_ID=MMETSP0737-20130205/1363_1 /TAXON_ID=385413 /ORGANISM="Thalassiosira miniscula, Strain CCMP1093" /LENGTH=655 /DNA_ID=CAMNT_0025930525 /DNA_START=215 /DNA_END=2182 /DNA_ORIENTATION=-
MKFFQYFLLVGIAFAGQNTANCNGPIDKATCLTQDDFDHGTKIITASGAYKLCEDIEFGPNGPTVPNEPPHEDAFDPELGGDFGKNEFGLGFFSALCIAASDVTIYLNGYTIEQSPGHALMQRFFAIFELASSPFIAGVGPAQFVSENSTFVPASNIEIRGPGRIGRSSHHGIHGNENTNVKIIDVEFYDFEVAAVSLNNVDSLEISGCNVIRNREDVPVVGLFSAARFLRPYAKFLSQQGYELEFKNPNTGMFENKKAEDLYKNLIEAINNVYNDVIYGNGFIDKQKHEEEYHLFHNPFRVIDGPCYAFLVHGKGPAVGGQGERFEETDDTVTSSNIVISNNNIANIQCWNNEVPALFGKCGDHGCAVNDVRGSIFQTIKTFDPTNPHLALGEDGTYKGNVVSDMQIMVAQAILDKKLPDIPSRQTGPNSIKEEIIDWATQGTDLEPQFVCNGDSMHHVIKGIIAIRVEDTEGFTIERNTIHNIVNLSVKPFSNCDFYHIGASSENLEEVQSGNVRAISVAAVRGYSTGNRQSQIKHNKIGFISSEEANEIIGIDVQGDSEGTNIQNNAIDLIDPVVDDPHDERYISVRVREAVDGSITIGNNELFQKTQILNFSPGVRGHAKNQLKRLHSHISGDIEWELGGCPFASDYAKKQ